MSKFKVGDVCEIVAVCRHQEMIGRECEVVSPFGNYPATDGKSYDGYRVRLQGESDADRPWLVYEWQLRKKRPKDDAEPRTDFTPCDEDFMDRLNSWRPKKDTRVAEKSALSDLRKLYEVKAEDEFRAKEIQKLRDFYMKFS